MSAPPAFPAMPTDPADMPSRAGSREPDVASPQGGAGLARALERLAADAAQQDYPPATLYIVATPIGNRADITVRALACLARVDAIAAEDTRTARPLLQHYGIDRPMIAAHRHNEHEAAATVVGRLAAGERIAYLSDAGTPGVSDPGARLVAAAFDGGFRVVPLPGASALTTAWSAAGLPEGPVHFAGFLPAKDAQARERLRALAALDAHLVFYEAPHRIVETTTAMAAIFGERRCVVARELTKRFETIHRGPVADMPAWLALDPQRTRGEFVVLVEAPPPGAADERRMQDALALLDRLSALSVSDAAALVAEVTGASRKAIYAEALRRRSEPDG